NSTIAFVGGRILNFDNVDGGGSFGGTTVTSTDHDGVRIINSAGTFALPALMIAGATPTAVDAISLENNAGATIGFAGLSLNTNGGRGIAASGGGTLNVSEGTSSITSTGAAALDLSGVTLGNGSGGPLTLASVSSLGSAEQGIDLNAVTGW